MAVYFKGLSVAERVAWTKAVTESGTTIDWSDCDLSGPVLDKHSTGGVGDGVSLMLAPMLASCGAYIPMIAGRGLAHTGGTIDKLESIPGYNTGLPLSEFKKVVSEVGCAIVSQTPDLAPTDRRVYSVRDVTATVENIGLITASILSKKIASGISSLVLDVKTGKGAVMQSLDVSIFLAKSLVDVAVGAGLKTTAIITDMSQPLSNNAGNALEVEEAIKFLACHSSVNSRLKECVLALGVECLVNSGFHPNNQSALDALTESLTSGSALKKFSQMVEAMGGPVDFVSNYESYLPKAPVIRPVYSEKQGFITSFDVRAIGMTVVSLGGGRTSPESEIDHSVGLENIAVLGSKTDPKTPLCTIHALSESDYEMAAKKIKNAITVGESEVTCGPLIIEKVK